MKKFGLVLLAVVLALGVLGVGYAMWYEDLYIEGTVYTGEVYGYWTACYCFDPGLDPNPDGSNKGKDVGSTTCTIDPTDPRILYITVQNGYPCYWNDCEVEYTIGGTVPVHVEDIIIEPLNYTPASGYMADDGDLWVSVVDGIGLQLHPGDRDQSHQRDRDRAVFGHAQRPYRRAWLVRPGGDRDVDHVAMTKGGRGRGRAGQPGQVQRRNVNRGGHGQMGGQ